MIISGGRIGGIMLEGVKYLKFEGNGNAINEEMRCFFANEFPENDEEYFGEEGIAFNFDNPAVPEDCIVILTYENFYEVVKAGFANYVRNNQESQNEIWLLLTCLKEAIGVHA